MVDSAMVEQVYERRHDAGANGGLDLGAVASGDVGEGPTSLLADAVPAGAQWRKMIP